MDKELVYLFEEYIGRKERESKAAPMPNNNGGHKGEICVGDGDCYSCRSLYNGGHHLFEEGFKLGLRMGADCLRD